MNINKNDIYFGIALLFAIWFSIFGWFWVYWITLFIAYPFGIISFFIWLNIKKDGKPRNKFIPRVLIIGLIISLSFLIALLFRN